MNPFERIFNRYQHLPNVDISQGQSIAYSHSTTRRIMELIDANGQGNVHGGTIMRMVDEAAAIVAVKHSQRPNVVTARVDTFNFLAPAFIGDVVTVDCQLCYVGRTSMEIKVKVSAEDLITREIRTIANSYVIYVALDKERKPTAVPPLIPANEEERLLIEQARIRREKRKKLEEELIKLEEEDNATK